MDINKFLLFLALGFCINASNAAEGFVKLDAKGRAYLYTTSSIKNGDEVNFQYPGEKGVAKCCMSAVSDGIPQNQESPIVLDELYGKDVNLYVLKGFQKIAYSRPFIGVAYIGPKANVQGVNSNLLLRDGGNESLLETCLGAEGVNLTKTSHGKTEAHLYMSLGYDVTPTCSDPGYGSQGP